MFIGRGWILGTWRTQTYDYDTNALTVLFVYPQNDWHGVERTVAVYTPSHEDAAHLVGLSNSIWANTAPEPGLVMYDGAWQLDLFDGSQRWAESSNRVILGGDGAELSKLIFKIEQGPKRKEYEICTDHAIGPPCARGAVR